jgi:hypothetical protein
LRRIDRWVAGGTGDNALIGQALDLPGRQPEDGFEHFVSVRSQQWGRRRGGA